MKSRDQIEATFNAFLRMGLRLADENDESGVAARNFYMDRAWLLAWVLDLENVPGIGPTERLINKAIALDDQLTADAK